MNVVDVFAKWMKTWILTNIVYMLPMLSPKGYIGVSFQRLIDKPVFGFTGPLCLVKMRVIFLAHSVDPLIDP